VKKPVLGAVAVLAALGFTAMLAAPAQGACKPPRPRHKLSTKEISYLAKRWAQIRGLPPEWIAATILVESNGYPDLYGDCVGCTCKSIGLMQVNTIAHADDLRAQGLTRADMFDPDKNVRMGSLILRSRYDDVVKALAGRRLNKIALGTAVRLAYKGPSKILAAVRAGENARLVYPQAADRWDVALVQATALV